MKVYGGVAQLVEHLPEEQGVVGSIPTPTTDEEVRTRSALRRH